jgi:hypothetical protein
MEKGKRSSPPLKGAALKVSQHTHLPFSAFFMQLAGKCPDGVNE